MQTAQHAQLSPSMSKSIVACFFLIACVATDPSPPPETSPQLYVCHLHAYCPADSNSEIDMLGTPCIVGSASIDDWSSSWLAYCDEHEGDLHFGSCSDDWQCDAQCEPSGDTCTPSTD
jgi:hypothetical protein